MKGPVTWTYLAIGCDLWCSSKSEPAIFSPLLKCEYCPTRGQTSNYITNEDLHNWWALRVLHELQVCWLLATHYNIWMQHLRKHAIIHDSGQLESKGWWQRIHNNLTLRSRRKLQEILDESLSRCAMWEKDNCIFTCLMKCWFQIWNLSFQPFLSPTLPLTPPPTSFSFIPSDTPDQGTNEKHHQKLSSSLALPLCLVSPVAHGNGSSAWSESPPCWEHCLQ